MNKLLIVSDHNNGYSYIAVFTGITGSGEEVFNEEAHNICGKTDDEIIAAALTVWGADRNETTVNFVDESFCAGDF